MLETFDADVRDFTSASREADRALAVRFYMHPIQNDVRTAEEGRPIFDDVLMIEIRVRGDRNNVVQRPAREEDKQRFRDIYRSFEAGTEQGRQGTPLAEWPIMSSSMVEELKYLGFFTVEQVAEANEASMSRVTGLRMMKEKAQRFLELAKGNAPVTQLEQKVAEISSQLEAAQQMNQQLMARLEALSKAQQKSEVAVAETEEPAAATPVVRAAPRR